MGRFKRSKRKPRLRKILFNINALPILNFDSVKWLEALRQQGVMLVNLK